MFIYYPSTYILSASGEPMDDFESKLWNIVMPQKEEKHQVKRALRIPPPPEDEPKKPKAMKLPKILPQSPSMLPYDPTKCEGCEGEMNRQISVENGDTGECFICSIKSCLRKLRGEKP